MPIATASCGMRTVIATCVRSGIAPPVSPVVRCRVSDVRYGVCVMAGPPTNLRPTGGTLASGPYAMRHVTRKGRPVVLTARRPVTHDGGMVTRVHTPGKLYLDDAASTLGVTRSTLSTWRSRGVPVSNPFPEPDGVDMINGHARPYWHPASVKAWSSRRQGRGRRSD